MISGFLILGYPRLIIICCLWHSWYKVKVSRTWLFHFPLLPKSQPEWRKSDLGSGGGCVAHRRQRFLSWDHKVARQGARVAEEWNVCPRCCLFTVSYMQINFVSLVQQPWQIFEALQNLLKPETEMTMSTFGAIAYGFQLSLEKPPQESLAPRASFKAVQPVPSHRAPS